MRFRLTPSFSALAFVLVTALARCSVYDEQLLEETATTGGGSSSDTLTSSTSGPTTTTTGVGTFTSNTGSSVTNSGPNTSSTSTTSDEDTTSETSTNSSSGGSAGTSATTGGAVDTSTADTGSGGATATETVTATDTVTASATTGSVVDPLLIDDLEDGNGQLVSPLNGYWYLAVDDVEGVGTITAPTNPATPKGETTTPTRPGSTLAMHAAGSWTSCIDPCWGAALGFSFSTPDTVSIDASGYAGISFYARASAARTIRIEIATDETITASDHYGVNQAITTAWQQYQIMWDDLEPVDWSPDAVWAPGVMLKIQFHFGITAFDFWIDDVRFIE